MSADIAKIRQDFAKLPADVQQALSGFVWRKLMGKLSLAYLSGPVEEDTIARLVQEAYDESRKWAMQGVKA